ncbi:MAG: hypothetical protein M3Z85_12600 [Acidobacteriota bacterium]|nr:hypothetical protein [Acidobacteriota bacterium]
MKRRTYLQTMLAGAAAAVTSTSAAQQPIQLHVDLNVDPAKETEMLHNFHTIFKPAAMKQAGYIDVKMEKLRSALMGSAPANVNYRFVLTYASEEQRKVWVDTPVHKKVWPAIENTLVSKDYQVLLFDIK